MPSGPFYETWLAKKFESSKSSKVSKFSPSNLLTFLPSNKNVLQLPDDYHLMANGYANSWIIDPKEICKRRMVNGKWIMDNCQENPDGSYDMELVVEFWPQRLFYIGLFISGMTLFGCLGYLVYDSLSKRKVIIP